MSDNVNKTGFSLSELWSERKVEIIIAILAIALISRLAFRFLAGSTDKRKRVISFSNLKPVSMEDRCVGLLLGTAVGDAKGAPYEGLTREQIQSLPKMTPAVFSPIPSINKNTWLDIDKHQAGMWTDDTQLSMAIARSIVTAGDFDIDVIVQEHIRAYKPDEKMGYGPSTANAINKLRENTHNYKNSGNTAATGNGVLMKMASLALFYTAKKRPQQQEDQEVEILTRMSHDNNLCVVASLIHVRALKKIFTKAPSAFDTDSSRKRWLEEILQDSLELERKFGLTNKDELFSERFKQLLAKLGSLSDDDIVSISRGATSHVVDTLSVVYGLFASKPTFNSVLKAVTLGGDTDSTAGIVGGMIGGLRGPAFIPPHYINNTSGSLVRADEITDVAQNLAVVLQRYANSSVNTK